MDNKILTYDTFWSLVDIDDSNSQIKKMATIFLEAMYDWPTNRNKITDYIFELKEYFGVPISIEGISKKNSNMNDAWKLESGASIQNLIKLSEKKFNESDFDKILNDIILHYENHFKTVDFIAELKYHSEEMGGRKTPVISGYRPQIKFKFTEMQTSGQQTFIGRNVVNSGENIKAKIKISSPVFFTKKLDEGMKFEFCEGETIIGTGTIEYIVNEKLEKPAGNNGYN
jgi:hypothetical protein